MHGKTSWLLVTVFIMFSDLSVSYMDKETYISSVECYRLNQNRQKWELFTKKQNNFGNNFIKDPVRNIFLKILSSLTEDAPQPYRRLKLNNSDQCEAVLCFCGESSI